VVLIGCAASACSLLVDTGGFDEPAVDGGSESSITPPAVLPESGPESSTDAPHEGDGPTLGPCGTVVDDLSLVAWFSFDDGDLAKLTDCSPSHYVATPFPGSTVKYAPGHASTGALDVDGASCFDFGPAPALAASAFTVSAWIQPRQFSVPNDSGNPSPRNFVSHVAATGTLAYGWGMGTDDSAGVELKIFDTSGVYEEAQYDATPKNVWVHVAGVWTGAEIQVFVNGGLVQTFAATKKPAADPNAHGRLGCRFPGQSPWDGLVDEVRIYTRALMPAEIATLSK
jgi:hypothetical protein